MSNYGDSYSYPVSVGFSEMIPSLVMMLFLWLTAGLIGGLICRALARHKGYSTAKWFWLAFFFPYIALPYMIGLPLSEGKRRDDIRAVLSELPKA